MLIALCCSLRHSSPPCSSYTYPQILIPTISSFVVDPCDLPGLVVLSEASWNIGNTAGHALKLSDIGTSWFKFAGDAGTRMADRVSQLKMCTGTLILL